MEWQPIKTAPIDTLIEAQIPGYDGEALISSDDGFVDSAGNDCRAWVWRGDDAPPESWTDGVCWECNDNDEQSAKPVAWKYPQFWRPKQGHKLTQLLRGKQS